jgi:hypothetical protein
MSWSFLVSFNYHPAGQPEGDPVLGVDTHAVYQPGSQVLVKPGDEFKYRVILGYPLPKTTNRI